MIHFKITSPLLAAIQADLHRRHAFAYERVGFILASMSWAADGLILLAHDYHPVADEDYLDDPSVGAMMGPSAIRKALQVSMSNGCAFFHVHSHGGRGVPGFSPVDLRENDKFVPDFFKVTPQRPHGAIVLSNTAARGAVWLSKKDRPEPIDKFSVAGSPLRIWSVK